MLFLKYQSLREILVHTGQHFDSNMSDVFFNELEIKKPDYFLDIHGGSHGAMTGRMLQRLEEVIKAESPDAVMVYGDTNSTLAEALAAVKLHVPIAHVEAGLRSFNMSMPEEVNRILTDRVSRWLFAPTSVATEHLNREGVNSSSIEEVGDVMYDVAMHHGRRVHETGRILSGQNLMPTGYILATIHRAENTDHPGRLNAIVDGLEAVAEQIPVVWPIHPRTRGVLMESGRLATLSSRFRLIDPVGYLDMVQLEKYAAVIATDSGGVQKEAFFYQVPCVTLRDETEWVELVQSKWNRLVSPVSADVVSQGVFAAIGSVGISVNPYGDGNAASRIARTLAKDLTG